MLKSFLEACYLAAQEAQEALLALDHLTGCEPLKEGAGGDISITYDIVSENIFIKHLSSFGQIYSEEAGHVGQGDLLIVIDPVDGSDNLKSQFPYYGASIALQKENQNIAAFVCNFATGECFVKAEGLPYLRKLSDVTFKEKIEINKHARVGLFEKAGLHPGAARTLMDVGLKFRAPGAVALSLAYAHSVMYVVFLGKMRSFDIEAGLFLCEDLNIYKGENILVVSHNKDVFAKILTIFNLEDDSSIDKVTI